MKDTTIKKEGNGIYRHYMPWLNENSTLNKKPACYKNCQNNGIIITYFLALEKIIINLTDCKLHYIFNDVTLFWYILEACCCSIIMFMSFKRNPSTQFFHLTMHIDSSIMDNKIFRFWRIRWLDYTRKEEVEIDI